jgi:2-methylcitrate dehydratase PrpD
MPLVCEPIARKRDPRGMIDAQFSVPFNVALGLLRGWVAFPDFTEAAFRAPDIRRLMGLVTCAVDPALDAQYPQAWPARVEVALADGRRLTAETRHAKGDPRNPLTEAEVVAKHRGIVAGLVEDAVDDRNPGFIHELDRQPDLGALTAILRGVTLPD